VTEGQTPQQPDKARSQRAFATFLQSNEQASQSLKKNAEALDALGALIGHEKDGLIAAMDDLIDELQAHRAEMVLLRSAISGVKVDVDIASLFRKRR
jgi:uncharacterized protein (DUF1786 family)